MSACAKRCKKSLQMCDATFAVIRCPIRSHFKTGSKFHEQISAVYRRNQARTDQQGLREIFDHWNQVEEKTGKTRGK